MCYFDIIFLGDVITLIGPKILDADIYSNYFQTSIKSS